MVPPQTRKVDERPQPRLYLVTPAAADIASLKLDLLAALDSADIAAVLLRLPDEDDRSLINRVKALAPTVQRGGRGLHSRRTSRPSLRAAAPMARIFAASPKFEESVEALKPGPHCRRRRPQHPARDAHDRRRSAAPIM